jgi:2-polyprenyl-3-methyl-5-hydroxy-6-metoxy-1,4-benzoquinol methylase
MASRIQKCLEVGCGAGGLSSALVKTLPGLSLTAIDLSPKMIEHAERTKGHPRIQFRQGDFFEIAGTYNIFVSAYTWVFFPLEESVKKLSNLLEPSGKFFILNVGKSAFTEVYLLTLLTRILHTPIYLHHPQTFQKVLQKNNLFAQWQLIDSFEGSYLIFGQKGNF